MPGRQAKILTEDIIHRALVATSRRRQCGRDKAMLLLSLRAGLRACEIAGLEWDMVVEANGRIAQNLTIPDRIAKLRGGRRIPLHPDLRTALQALRRTGSKSGPVVLSARGGKLRANSIVNWFVTLYAEIGAKGCSSHSGRRTFITSMAKNTQRAGASLRDVQLLAGHKSIEITQGYIDGDSDAQRRLIAFL